jgi:transmembrane sensor
MHPSPSREIKAEAAAWIARLHADTRNAADERAFQTWLATSSAHAQAFETMTSVWEASGGVDYRAVQDPARVRMSRRQVLASVSATMVGVAAFGVWQSAYAGVYETDVGEQKHLALADGTQVFLDTNTRIRAHFDNQVRSVVLERGRANFRVDADPVRPFIVDAATRRIVASAHAETPTAMDIRRDDDTVSVVLIRGRATVTTKGETQVAELNAQMRGNTLAAGERAIIPPTEAPQLDRPNLTPLLAWQTGQAVFENETLNDAIKEMNRYSAVKLVVNDAATGNMRLSGVYRVGDNAAFARSVATLLRVELHRTDGQLQLAAATSR